MINHFLESGVLSSGLEAMFRAKREALCMTQWELSNRLGVDVNTVKRWEAGGANITQKYLRMMIVDFLNGVLDEVLRSSASGLRLRPEFSLVVSQMHMLYSMCRTDASRRRILKDFRALETKLGNRLAKARRENMAKLHSGQK